MPAWNPRLVAYASSLAQTPEAVMATEGWTLAFVQWNNAQWEEFEKLHPEWQLRHDTGFDGVERRHWFRASYAAEYDAWLQARWVRGGTKK